MYILELRNVILLLALSAHLPTNRYIVETIENTTNKTGGIGEGDEFSLWENIHTHVCHNSG